MELTILPSKLNQFTGLRRIAVPYFGVRIKRIREKQPKQGITKQIVPRLRTNAKFFVLLRCTWLKASSTVHSVFIVKWKTIRMTNFKSKNLYLKNKTPTMKHIIERERPANCWRISFWSFTAFFPNRNLFCIILYYLANLHKPFIVTAISFQCPTVPCRRSFI